MKNGKRVILTVIAAMAIFTAMSAAAIADDQDREQLMLKDQTRLMDQICKDTVLSQAEIDGITPEVKRSLQVAGDGEPVRNMVKAAKSEGCQGECLVESIRLHTRAMEQGLSAGEAQAMIRKEIRICVRERAEIGISDAEMSLRLRSRVEERILARIGTGQGTGQKEPSMSGNMGSSGSGDSQTRGGGSSGSGGKK